MYCVARYQCWTSFLQVVYTDGDNMQIRVHADVVNPEAGTHDTTNIFHFTFKPVDKEPVPPVIPMAYHGDYYSSFFK